jgi:PAS domain S-box-containing protein
LGQATIHQKLHNELVNRQWIEATPIESEQRYAALAAAAPVGIFRTDAEGLCTYVNDRFLEMVGYTREELDAGMIHWDAMTPPEYLPGDVLAMERLMQHARSIPWKRNTTVRMAAGFLSCSEPHFFQAQTIKLFVY